LNTVKGTLSPEVLLRDEYQWPRTVYFLHLFAQVFMNFHFQCMPENNSSNLSFFGIIRLTI